MNAPLSNTFDPATAARLAEFSASAYRPASPIIVENRTTGALAAVTPIDEDLVIAFRGTCNLANVIIDACCRRTPLFRGSSAEVHAGFLAAFRSIEEKLRATITGHLSARPDLRLWFTGHSLGGALAKLAAFHFASANTSVYTFGEPRSGNAAFRNAYDSQLRARTFRVVHADDIVPRLPWMLGAYRHSGHEAFFPMTNSPAGIWPGKGRVGRWLLDPPVWSKLPYDLAALACEFCGGRLVLLADHHIDSYRRLFVPGLNLNANLNTVPAVP